MKARIKRPNQDPGIALPRIGFIKTGFKNDKGYPQSTDYFICDSQYNKYFNDAYQKPSTIQIVFFDDRPQISCKEEYILMDKDGKRYGQGDGELFEIWDGEKYQIYKENESADIIKSAVAKSGSKKGWEISLTMRFILPKIHGIYGYFEYHTKGKASTIPKIRETFDNILEKRGFVVGMIFDLNVEFAKSQKPGKASRYPVVSLIPNHSQDNMQIIKNAKLLNSINNEQLNLES